MTQEPSSPFQATTSPSVSSQNKGGNASAKVWLVCNPASGSNDDEAVQELTDAFEAAGFTLDRIVRFPDDKAPTPADLDAQGVAILSVFGGDGTTHSIVAAASGWGGAVLVLPGGTMNLLAKRMHGDVPAPEVIARLRPSGWQTARPKVIRTSHGIGLSGSLAGPGAVWNDVREALRSGGILDFVASAKDAITQSTSGPKVTCPEIPDSRPEGYAGITLEPHDDGIEANGYYAESLADYAGQGMALLNRDFRDGPHDELGRHQRLRLVCPTGDPMGLLVDGEPFEGSAEEIFELVDCEVDLVMTKECAG